MVGLQVKVVGVAAEGCDDTGEFVLEVLHAGVGGGGDAVLG